MSAPLEARQRVRAAELAIEAQLVLTSAAAILRELAGVIDIEAPTATARDERERRMRRRDRDEDVA